MKNSAVIFFKNNLGLKRLKFKYILLYVNSISVYIFISCITQQFPNLPNFFLS